MTVIVTTTLDKSGSGSNGNKEITLSFRTGALPLDDAVWCYA